jgi:hypothetical protein
VRLHCPVVKKNAKRADFFQANGVRIEYDPGDLDNALLRLDWLERDDVEIPLVEDVLRR